MGSEVLKHLPPKQQLKILSLEASRRKSGKWPPWEMVKMGENSFPDSRPGSWPTKIECAYRNEVFGVLERKVEGGIHLAISSLSGKRPTFHEMQRIKNELISPEAMAVEIYPPHSQLVDEADMFHIWALEKPLPFTIYEK